jgi:hypothetical protein
VPPATDIVRYSADACPMPAHSRPCYDAPCMGPCHGVDAGGWWTYAGIRSTSTSSSSTTIEQKSSHASPPPPTPLPSSNNVDGQTNLIKFIPFVCPSQVHASRGLLRHPLLSSNNVDGQTNWKKNIPFVCPSQVHFLYLGGRRSSNSELGARSSELGNS